MMDPLTKTQLMAFEFIRERIERTKAPPTLRELCEHMGYSAVGSAQDVVAALRKKGFLETPARQAARSLALTALGREFGRRARVVVDDRVDEYDIPCLGSVPAGNPLEAIEERVGTLKISRSLLPTPKPRASQLFALKAAGLSMIGAGIMDGDWLVVKAQEEAEHGQIVVARVEGESTVKRLLKDPRKGWYLNPENPDFSPVYAAEQPFEVIGRVVALQRSFS